MPDIWPTGDQHISVFYILIEVVHDSTLLIKAKNALLLLYVKLLHHYLPKGAQMFHQILMPSRLVFGEAMPSTLYITILRKHSTLY